MDKYEDPEHIQLTFIPNIAVNVSTQEEYNALVKLFLQCGLKWSRGTGDFAPEVWVNYYKEESCLKIFPLGPADDKGLRFIVIRKKQVKILDDRQRIISFKEFLELQGLCSQILIMKKPAAKQPIKDKPAKKKTAKGKRK
jgi:hypothetical protein